VVVEFSCRHNDVCTQLELAAGQLRDPGGVVKNRAGIFRRRLRPGKGVAETFDALFKQKKAAAQCCSGIQPGRAQQHTHPYAG
jgi:hypothetical protein